MIYPSTVVYLTVILGVSFRNNDAAIPTLYDFYGKLCSATKATIQLGNYKKEKCAILCKRNKCGVFSFSDDHVCSIYPFPLIAAACLTPAENATAPDFYFMDVEEPCFQTNPAVGKAVVQSGGSGLADPILAVDGIREYKNYPSTVCCDSEPPPYTFPWLRIDLLQSYTVKKVVLYNRGESQALSNRLRDFEIRVGDIDFLYCDPSDGRNIPNAICAQSMGKFYAEGRNEFPCVEPVTGRYVSIQIVKMCTYSGCPSNVWNIINLCEFEVWGSLPTGSASVKETNIALKKPVIQRNMNATWLPYDVVDGKEPPGNKFNYSPPNKKAQCQATSAQKWPWWRVDMGSVYKVKGVTVFNIAYGKNARLHDFVIRIGFMDVAKLTGQTIFTGNPLCYQLMDTILPADFPCKHSIWGRFVSIQIVDSCDYQGCKSAESQNILNMCEFEVWGFSPFQNFTVA